MKTLKNLLPIIAIIGLLAWAGCKKDDDETVLASFSHVLTENPGEVVFTNLSSNADVYEWKFGDGTSPVTFVNPTHTYEENDSYVVTLVCQGSAGTGVTQDTIVVNNIP